jgi:hydrogenase maturation factor HypF (carbamoyltransferase family)
MTAAAKKKPLRLVEAPAPRSPARQALADAIKAAAKAGRLVDANAAAIEACQERVSEASADLESAITAVQKAKADDAKFMARAAVTGSKVIAHTVKGSA